MSPSLNRRRGRDEHIKIQPGKTPHEHKQNSNAEIETYKHTQMHLSLNIQRKQHNHIPAFEHQYKLHRFSKQQYLSFDEEFTRNQLRRCNIPPNHRPACSSISQQRCHPRAGHDSFRIRVNCRLTRSQGDTKQPNQTLLGLIGHQQQPSQHIPRGQPLHTSSKTTLHSPVKKEKQPWIIPTEDEAQLKPTRQHGFVLGPNMAKTTQL